MCAAGCPLPTRLSASPVATGGDDPLHGGRPSHEVDRLADQPVGDLIEDGRDFFIVHRNSRRLKACKSAASRTRVVRRLLIQRRADQVFDFRFVEGFDLFEPMGHRVELIAVLF